MVEKNKEATPKENLKAPKKRKKEKKAGESKDIALEPIGTLDSGLEPLTEPPPPKKGKGGKLLYLFIILTVIGLLAAVLFLNLFNIRDKYLSGFLSKIPIVSNLVEPETSPSDPYGGYSHDELVAEISRLESQATAYEEEITSLTNKNNIYLDEVTKLQAVSDNQAQFEKDKQAFDAMIAMNDPGAYAAFYEQINPENAEQLYINAITETQNSKDLKKYLSTIQAVDEGEAALILEELIPTDMELVVLILNNLDSEKSGAIITNMEAQNAASVVKQMSPPQN